MNWLERLLFPPSCQLCGVPTTNDTLCAHCASDIHVIDTACPLCALPNDDGSVCALCSQQPPYWQSAHSCFVYDGNLAELIRHWKYRKQRVAQALLCNAMTAWLVETQFITTATAIIPVPLHRNKLRQRGFNTSYHLAQAASKALNLPVITQALIRRQHTQSQAGLSKIERHRNLLGAFDLNIDALKQHEHVLLIDDVYTTGATAQICTQLFQDKQVNVHLLTLARALPPNEVAQSLAITATKP